MALESSPENPAPLRVVSAAIAGWVAKLGAVWVEGQVTQVNARTGMSQAFINLRDIEHNLSAQVVTSPTTLAALGADLNEGDRVVLLVKPEFWANRGQLVLRASVIRQVGLGDLLARVERLKAQLAKEGLFHPDRKQQLPFLPRVVGLICGRDSAAERDVIENATRRWPSIRFELREVAVQGNTAASAVTEALRELDAKPDVDVIIVTRGGGNAEDLLPFSDEELIRTVAACQTPVVSAIGHEQDAPLLDFVADVRASTPTDAARLVVPDLDEQYDCIEALHTRLGRAITNRLDAEAHRLHRLAAHPGLTDPSQLIKQEADQVDVCRLRAAKSLAHTLQLATSSLDNLRGHLRAYSPQATLDRGYSIVLDSERRLVRSRRDAVPGETITVKVSDGEFESIVADGRIFP